MGSPLLKTASWRSVKVNCEKSSLLVTASAPANTGWRFWSQYIRPRCTLPSTVIDTVSEACCGSRVAGSVSPMFIRIV
jgi:hypothetical protein